mmetsp:Transcript_29895/g.53524  ORF Transcript_29895/g.53524 Transcript_29895/m.53524 type:complete len:94 (-) Transcript_29895:273-554(-)
MFSIDVVACCEIVYTVPAALAARAAAHSPSGCASFCIATGATMIGVPVLTPIDGRTHEVSTVDTSTSTRGHIVIERNALVFSSSVTSSSAPPA